MTNLDSILKTRDITLPTKVCLVKATAFPVMYGCESWTVKKAERWRIDVFELWCWRRLLRVPWTARRSNQSMSLDELWELVMDREAWHAAIHGVAKSRTRLSDWTELIHQIQGFYNFNHRCVLFPISIKSFLMSLALSYPLCKHIMLSSAQFSQSCCVSLPPHGLQHARLPCLSPTPGACSNSCPSSQWCHPTISSSVRKSIPRQVDKKSVVPEENGVWGSQGVDRGLGFSRRTNFFI